LQDVANNLLQKTGGNPVMIRVAAAQIRVKKNPPELYNVNVTWTDTVVGINLKSDLLRFEGYPGHPKDAYKNTIKKIESQAQKVLAVLYHSFQPLQKVPITDLCNKWELVTDEGPSREKDVNTGLNDLHFKNAIERDQDDGSYPHGAYVDSSILSCAVTP
jgi:hypothetical protein